MSNELKFEVGDRVYCPYYQKQGFITSITPNPNNKDLGMNLPDYINITTDEGHVINSKLIHKSGNNVLPFYMQMVCKKDGINWNAVWNKAPVTDGEH